MGEGTAEVCEKGRTKMKESKEVIHVMGICEVDHVFLRPNQLYRFEVIEGCEKCKKLAEVYEKVDNPKQKD